LVYVLGRSAGGAKLPSVGLCLNASKAESRLVMATISLDPSLCSGKYMLLYLISHHNRLTGKLLTRRRGRRSSPLRSTRQTAPRTFCSLLCATATSAASVTSPSSRPTRRTSFTRSPSAISKSKVSFRGMRTTELCT
jgi:hypothetical protein